MIILMTGVPGASKTLNAIKFINEDKQFEGRPVFYHNVRKLQTQNAKGVEVLRSHWTEITDEQALKWYDLPKGSIVLIDECQDLFPVNTSRKSAPPEVLSKMAKHRHLGIDLVLITQEPRNIDAFVRRLVGLHRHHHRIFGSTKIRVSQWDGRCVDDVHDYHLKQEALNSVGRIDPLYFGVYHSAEVHTHKTRLPWSKIAIVVLPLLFIPYVGYRLLDKFLWTDDENPAAPPAQLSFAPNSLDLQPQIGFEQSDWLYQHTPRFDGLDFTAPVYDDLREPITYPWPNCVHWVDSDECSCYTQQATRMEVQYELCISIVENGLFDYSKDNQTPSLAGSQSLSEREGLTAEDVGFLISEWRRTTYF